MLTFRTQIQFLFCSEKHPCYELNYVRCDGRCKTDIETHRFYNPSPDILCGVEMQCKFVIWYL
jgi:hypothetical protein